MKKLVIAEKNSVAKSIAKVILNNYEKNSDGFYEDDKYIVAFASGHLLGLYAPSKYNEKWQNWNTDNLPIIPDKMLYEPIKGQNKLLNSLCRQMNRKDVESLVCATDAGREGELIFRLIYEYKHCTKPFKRLWLSSMEEKAISEGFKNLKPSESYDNLYNAAKCRQVADWLVGMNGTRLFTIVYGNGSVYKVGRVQSPTLNLINLRDSEIKEFTSEKYYHKNIVLSGVNFRSIEKYVDYNVAVADSFIPNTKAIIDKIEYKDKNTLPPKLYDLTLLQRTANKLLGFSAKKTLDLAQSLYEKKYITYPRTDSKYITSDMRESIIELIGVIEKSCNITIPYINVDAVINDKRVTDHHAILPTKEILNSDNMSEDEKCIFYMVTYRVLEAVSDKMVQSVEKVIAVYNDEEYCVTNTVMKNIGYKQFTDILTKLFNNSTQNSDSKNFNFSKGSIKVDDYCISEHTTKPKEHYTEDTLLKAMEMAGNKEVSADVERKGLGTSATRATIIEKLVNQGYVKRDNKKLLITKNGEKLLSVLPEEVKSVNMTVEWENKLADISKGCYLPDNFISDIAEIVKQWTNKYKAFETKKESRLIGKCPVCGYDVEVKKTLKGMIYYGCSHCEFKLWENDFYFSKLGKKINEDFAKSLLEKGEVLVENIKSKKSRNNYNAIIKMRVGDDKRPNYIQEFVR